MNKILTILIAIMLVISISGCIGGKSITTPSGYGLEITNFTSTSSAVRSNRTTVLSMFVENQGDYKIDKDTGLALLILPSDWGVSPSKNIAYSKDIGVEDAIKGTPMGTNSFRWTLTAPNLPEGISRTDIITGRVFYDYETKASGNIYVYPESELVSARERGDKINVLSYETTNGPIGITMEVTPDPVSIYTAGETFTLTVTLKNLDKGSIYNQAITSTSYTLSEANRNKALLTISTPDFTITNNCAGTIEFFSDESTAICDVRVPTVPATKQPYPITVTLKYGYQIDKTLEITTNGV